ncbi:hypothetical protein DPMN_088746 [Dreissena polymorpha]|uniref:Uncharacterized protein n=1 Tax=Dreissena polymorpha TaxID=45954 RepID=A0A9D4KV40_DREPO|nr:hypothetical protein DPMN_088746 [Dreissena polymorpha]
MLEAFPPLLTRLRMINCLPRQALINTRVDIGHALLSEQFSASILSKAITPMLGEKLLQETSFPALPNCFTLATSTAAGPNLSTFNSQAQRLRLPFQPHGYLLRYLRLLLHRIQILMD